VLGFNHLRTLVQAVALGASFQSVPGVNLEQFWRYSLNTAKICRPLARSLKLPDGAAFTAAAWCMRWAIWSCTSGCPTWWPRSTGGCRRSTLKRAEVERSVLGYTYADVSAAFAQRWDFRTSS
jgi:hypothetical protein